MHGRKHLPFTPTYCTYVDVNIHLFRLKFECSWTYYFDLYMQNMNFIVVQRLSVSSQPLTGITVRHIRLL